MPRLSVLCDRKSPVSVLSVFSVVKYLINHREHREHRDGTLPITENRETGHDDSGNSNEFCFLYSTFLV